MWMIVGGGDTLGLEASRIERKVWSRVAMFSSKWGVERGGGPHWEAFGQGFHRVISRAEVGREDFSWEDALDFVLKGRQGT